MKPFVTQEEYLATEFKVDMFQNGVGKELHKKLEELSNNSRNWVGLIQWLHQDEKLQKYL